MRRACAGGKVEVNGHPRPRTSWCVSGTASRPPPSPDRDSWSCTCARAAAFVGTGRARALRGRHTAADSRGLERRRYAMPEFRVRRRPSDQSATGATCSGCAAADRSEREPRASRESSALRRRRHAPAVLQRDLADDQRLAAAQTGHDAHAVALRPTSRPSRAAHGRPRRSTRSCRRCRAAARAPGNQHGLRRLARPAAGGSARNVTRVLMSGSSLSSGSRIRTSTLSVPFCRSTCPGWGFTTAPRSDGRGRRRA